VTTAVTTTETASRPSALRTNLALLGISVAVAFLVLEIGARTLLPAPLPWRYPQITYRADPALGFVLAPDQHSFTADKPVTTNERGLRGKLVPYSRAAGERVLFLGDSITFGYGVFEDEAVSERLRALRATADGATETINTGVPAYSLLQEVNYFEREGFRYRPDWVVVGYCWNDIGDKSEVRVDAHGRLTDATGDAGEESPLAYRVRNVVKQSRFLYGALQGWRALGELRAPDSVSTLRAEVLDGRDTTRTRDGWHDIGVQLQRLRSIADREGIKVLVVAFPIPIKLDRPFPNSSYPKRLIELASSTGVPVIDLEPSFRAEYRGHESLFIPYDGDHPNAAGHAIAAKEINAFLAAHAHA
jgi:lysophospholipase L1-like esterase